MLGTAASTECAAFVKHNCVRDVPGFSFPFFLIDKGSNRGFGGLRVACWPLVPKFVGSNPAEAVEFLGRKKSSARLSSEGK